MCKECDKTFLTEDILRNHIIEKHNLGITDSKVFRCLECPFTTKMKGNLNVHVLIKHSNERPFKCTQCDASFAVNFYLTRHMKKEHEVKHMKTVNEYKCMDCNLSFARNDSLKKHARHHQNPSNSNVKIFHCEMCNYKALTKYSVDVHMRTKHSSESPYKCTECGESFPVKRYLSIHFSKNHPGKEMDISNINSRNDAKSNMKPLEKVGSIEFIRGSKLKNTCNQKQKLKDSSSQQVPEAINISIVEASSVPPPFTTNDGNENTQTKYTELQNLNEDFMDVQNIILGNEYNECSQLFTNHQTVNTENVSLMNEFNGPQIVETNVDVPIFPSAP